MLSRLIREERGATLVMALGVMLALSVTTASTIAYTSANGRHAERSDAEQAALHLAEAGINVAVSVLGHDDANALASATLTEPAATPCPDGPNCFEQVYDTGSVRWRGDFAASGAGGVWTITSWGIVANPSPGLAGVEHKLVATVSVVPNPGQPLNATAWNFILAWGTSDDKKCDMKIENTAHVDAPLYVMGNLCLRNSAKVYQPNDADPVTLVVAGKLEVEQGTQATKSKVGDSSAPADWISRAEIGGGCTKDVDKAAHACNPASPTDDRIWAETLQQSVTTIATAPVADFAGWYQHANPGPRHPCNPASSSPVFDNDSTLNLNTNGSVGTVDLTPASSYTCTGKDAGGAIVGELSWNAATKTLAVSGVIYIDGTVEVDDNVLIKYQGQAALYLTGKFKLKEGNTRLCAAWSGSNCDFAAWDPDEDMLMIVASSKGDGKSIEFDSSVQFQGALFADGEIDLGNSSSAAGPMIARTVKVHNSAQIKPLPPMDLVPLGAPGNPNTHATPQKPVYTSSRG
ncbi:MAG: hypothetical protein WD689_06290 [Gaiellaceae bacterium]